VRIGFIAFILLLNCNTPLYADFLDQSVEAIEARIAPIGKVQIDKQPAATTSQAPASAHKAQHHLGKTLFESHCVLCHGNGIAGAPRFGNKADWEPRIKKKLALLLKHVNKGYHAMPAKGACLECSPNDLEAAIRYMIDNVSQHTG
jgi:cytochrome c5